MFGGLLDETVQSICVYDKDIDILDSFTYLGSMVHNNGGSCPEVLCWIGLAYSVMDSLSVVSTCADGQRLKSSSRW